MQNATFPHTPAASTAVKEHMKDEESVRFVAVSLKEPPPNYSTETKAHQRRVEVVVLNSVTGIASELLVEEGEVIWSRALPHGTQVRVRFVRG